MSRIVILRRLVGAACVLAAAGCGPGGPEFVYVPGPGFEEALIARADLREGGRAGVGQWITLHANRVSGPWVRVRRAEVSDTVPCTRNVVPPSPDLAVETKVRWEVAPKVELTWNQPGPPDFERKVQFERPGRYELRAVSDGCRGDFYSNPVAVVVE